MPDMDCLQVSINFRQLPGDFHGYSQQLVWIVHLNLRNRNIITVQFTKIFDTEKDSFFTFIHWQQQPHGQQESCAIAKMTAQCSLYMGALKIFGTPCLHPQLLFPTSFKDFCSNRLYDYECSYKI